MGQTSLKELLTIEIRGHQFPFEIVREARRNWRISLARDTIRLRVPKRKMALDRNPRIWAREWLENHFDRRPELFARYTKPLPYSGQIYATIFGPIKLQFQKGLIKKPTGKLSRDGLLTLRIPSIWDQEDLRKEMRAVVSRSLAIELKPHFEARVADLNSRHFRYVYNKVTLKYNHSNWGSCSAKKNLNFSTRLLLAPAEVVDYVILHELAHLEILNHSRSFWDLVSTVCPDFRVHAAWLKSKGENLDF